MAKTYTNQLAADEAAIQAEIKPTSEAALLERAGRFSALSHRYAGYADFEAAERQRQTRDPKALVAVFCDQIGGPSAADLATLLSALHSYLGVRPELNDTREYIEEAMKCAEYQAKEEVRALAEQGEAA